MPPPPSRNKFAENKEKASQIFVDREQPRAVFRDALKGLDATPDQFSLITFYGVGGQGKTALCRELRRMCAQSKILECEVRAAHIDLHTNPPAGEIHALVCLRNAISVATGAAFPCFDLAYADYWQQTNPDKPAAQLGAVRLSGLRDDIKESIGDVVSGAATEVLEEFGGTVGDILSDTVGSIPIMGPLLKRTSKWAISAGYEALLKRNSNALDALYEHNSKPDPNIIRSALPDILAHEYALHKKKHPDQRLVLFIDEYESAMSLGGSEGSLQVNPWDAALREFIKHCSAGAYLPAGSNETTYDYSVGFLLVLLGREKLRWDEIEVGWEEDLTPDRQHLLGGLGDKDAQQFLEKAGIDEPQLRDAIVLACTAIDTTNEETTTYPVMLDLSIQIYFDLSAAGAQPTPEDFDVSGKTYQEKRRSLFGRFMRNYKGVPGLEGLLRRLACAQDFSRGVAQHLIEQFSIPFDLIHFFNIVDLSFVAREQNKGNYVIHSHMRDTLAATLSDEDKRETHEALGLWYERQSKAENFKSYDLRHAEAHGRHIWHRVCARLTLENVTPEPFALHSYSHASTELVLEQYSRAIHLAESRKESSSEVLCDLWLRSAYLWSRIENIPEAIKATNEARKLLEVKSGELNVRFLDLVATEYQTDSFVGIDADALKQIQSLVEAAQATSELHYTAHYVRLVGLAAYYANLEEEFSLAMNFVDEGRSCLLQLVCEWHPLIRLTERNLAVTRSNFLERAHIRQLRSATERLLHLAQQESNLFQGDLEKALERDAPSLNRSEALAQLKYAQGVLLEAVPGGNGKHLVTAALKDLDIDRFAHEAREAFKTVHDHAAQHLPADSVELAQSKSELASREMGIGRHQAAKDLQVQVIEILLNVVPARPSELIVALEIRAEANFALGNHSGGILDLCRALEIAAVKNTEKGRLQKILAGEEPLVYSVEKLISIDDLCRGILQKLYVAVINLHDKQLYTAINYKFAQSIEAWIEKNADHESEPISNTWGALKSYIALMPDCPHADRRSIVEAISKECQRRDFDPWFGMNLLRALSAITDAEDELTLQQFERNWKVIQVILAKAPDFPGGPLWQSYAAFLHCVDQNPALRKIVFHPHSDELLASTLDGLRLSEAAVELIDFLDEKKIAIKLVASDLDIPEYVVNHRFLIVHAPYKKTEGDPAFCFRLIGAVRSRIQVFSPSLSETGINGGEDFYTYSQAKIFEDKMLWQTIVFHELTLQPGGEKYERYFADLGFGSLMAAYRNDLLEQDVKD